MYYIDLIKSIKTYLLTITFYEELFLMKCIVYVAVCLYLSRTICLRCDVYVKMW